MLEAEFGSLPEFEPQPGASAEAMAQVLEETAHRLGDNYPYFHPLYAGQMLKPPHPVARAAYALAMKINPNNHARDGGRASSEMEIEAVAEIARMFGYREMRKREGKVHIWVISPRAERSRILRAYGWRDNWRREENCWRRSRRTIHTAASRRF